MIMWEAAVSAAKLEGRNGNPDSSTVLRDLVELRGKDGWVGCHLLDPQCITTTPQTWSNQRGMLRGQR